MIRLTRPHPFAAHGTRARTRHSRALHLESLEARALLSLGFRGATPALSTASDLFAPAVAVDGAGDIYVTGQFSGSVHLGTIELDALDNTMDMFVAKINPDGTYAWATQSRGSAQTGSSPVLHRGSGIAVAPNGDVYVTGWFATSAEFPQSATSTLILNSTANQEPFIAKVDPNTGLFDWAARIQGQAGDFDWATAIATDSSSNAYITGFYAHSLTFAPGRPEQTTLSGGGAYVAEYNSNGMFMRATPMTGRVQTSSIAVDAEQNLIVAGSLVGTATFGQDARSVTAQGSLDGFVAKLDNAGTSDWVADFGGPTNASAAANAVATNPAGDVYITGQFSGSVDFEPGPGTSMFDALGASAAFITKLTRFGQLVWVRRFGPPDSSNNADGDGIAVDSGGNVLVSGTFTGVDSFGPALPHPTAAPVFLASAGKEDLFVGKLDSSGTPLTAVRGGGTDSDHGYQLAVNNRTPALETIAVSGDYAGTAKFGSTTLTVNPNVTATVVTRLNDRPAIADYNGDGKSDVGVYGNGLFVAIPSGALASGGQPIMLQNFGTSAFRAVAGDYDGDGKTDVAVYGDGLFVAIPSGGGQPIVLQSFGGPGFAPVSGDYDGDGKSDPAVFKDGQFIVRISSSGQTFTSSFGGASAKGAQPLSGDFDGDGHSDYGFYNPNGGVFFVKMSHFGRTISFTNFGGPGFEALAGDYDGDGKTDIGLYGKGLFAIIPSGGGQPIIIHNFGNSAFQALSGDYDGDGKTDIGLYGGGLFVAIPSGGGQPIIIHNFGNSAFQALGAVAYANGLGTSAASVRAATSLRAPSGGIASHASLPDYVPLIASELSANQVSRKNPLNPAARTHDAALR